ncbi:hypothetical protein AHFPHNDE_03127 [Pseudomonas sp. MM227]|uniref:hypothetical protein n=1 Tax=Pseudomonas sp. MM227 TaxID=3019968 RepID=UPI00221E557B|nr:hypothetical protein [Pseudomonas sp. MM227]CAI3789431.1 hypothetical protein AHFPHNDE_03127 [Pseudomonas sp. MM227]
MTIGACDLLSYAALLNQNDALTEVERRNIVGRAYYSVFHSALELVEFDLKIDLSEIKASTHASLFLALKSHATSNRPLMTKLQALSRELKALHGHRVISDYYLSKTVTQTTVELVLAEASRLSRRISELQSTAAA